MSLLTPKQCDESKPICGACDRHKVECIYIKARGRHREQQSPESCTTQPGVVSAGQQLGQVNAEIDNLLEMRLMHKWTAYTCHTFSTARKYWEFQAPLIAFKHRHVLDGLLCLTALHAARQGGTADGSSGEAIDKMPYFANVYFQQAINGHRQTLANLSLQNVEAAYVCCTCITFAALVTLGERHESPLISGNDFTQWLKLARGMKHIVNQVRRERFAAPPFVEFSTQEDDADFRRTQWRDIVGIDEFMRCEVFHSGPDLSKPDQLYCRQNAEPFDKLLVWVDSSEILSPGDNDIYEKALCYVGLIYKGISEGFDHPLGTCRRIVAMASLLPARFVDMIELGQPRALAILIYVFACMKMVEEEVFWFKGVAEQQIPEMVREMPDTWRDVVSWPLSLIEGTNSRHIDKGSSEL